MQHNQKQEPNGKEEPMKTPPKEKISWSDRIDLSENIMLIIIASIVMAVLAFLATKLL